MLSPEAQAELIKLIDERLGQQLNAQSLANPDSPWLTVPEAAEFLRTTPGAIYKRIHRGQLRAHRPDGSRILLLRDDLANYWTCGLRGPIMITNHKWPREVGASGAVTPGGPS